jgi:molybdate transport system substrate-binding protein
MTRLLALFVTLLAPAALAADLTVFAAASLKEALDEVARGFAAASGHQVVVSYAASSALARQVEAGAPADLFIPADIEWMDYVAERKALRPGARTNLLGNQLVLVAPAASKATLAIGPGFALAAALGNERLAMANPDAVPAGKYGRAALQSLGVWKEIEARIARAENVRAALALVSRGETPFGIVYRTDALADPGVRIVGVFPASSHPKILYPAAITANARPGAAELFAWLRSPEARRIWENRGFVVLD